MVNVIIHHISFNVDFLYSELRHAAFFHFRIHSSSTQCPQKSAKTSTWPHQYKTNTWSRRVIFRNSLAQPNQNHFYSHSVTSFLNLPLIQSSNLLPFISYYVLSQQPSFLLLGLANSKRVCVICLLGLLLLLHFINSAKRHSYWLPTPCWKEYQFTSAN